MIHFHPPCPPQQVKILTEMEHIGTSSDIILLFFLFILTN